MTPSSYDALLILSFGGPEQPADVMPFLRNVTRGRGVPDERLAVVADHYAHFGGKSPLPEQVRHLASGVEAELRARGEAPPVYIGHRNWHPFLADTLARMKSAGVRRAAAFVTSAFSSYSGCRQYLEDIAAARATVGEGAPEIDKLRVFYDHPGYVGAVVDRALAALDAVPIERWPTTQWIFTAHSIPNAMAAGSAYEAQLRESMRLVVADLHGPGGDAYPRAHSLAFQSRSGPPAVPWLGPDVCDEIRAVAARGITDVVVVPIGFVSDHLEVLYDLDVEAKAAAAAAGVGFARAATAGTHRAFVSMVVELLDERRSGTAPRALGKLGVRTGPCPADCCPRGARGG